MNFDKSFKAKPPKQRIEKATNFSREIPRIVQRLMADCNSDDRLNHEAPVSIPSHQSIIQIIEQARRILFPNHFAHTKADVVHMEYCMGKELKELFENLHKQILLSVGHECVRSGQPCLDCIEDTQETALQYIRSLPEIDDLLAKDVRAALEGDPAAKSYDEVIFCYPGFFAITVYRLAHKLHELGVNIIPRIMTEYAHSLTGIDIHPGAKIGDSFFIDHGTGVVVGETTQIGNRVRIYQGVTLGALSVPREAIGSYRNVKRHPNIEDDVIIYSNATILGGETVIGARSIIGGNVWITESVLPDTKVLLKRPELEVLRASTAHKKGARAV